MDNQQLHSIDVAFLSVVRDLSDLPITVWKGGEAPTVVYYPCLTDKKLRQLLEAGMKGRTAPILFFENEFVFFGVLSVEDTFISLGPAARTHVTNAYSAQYFASHNIRCSEALPRCDTGVVTKYLALLYCHYTGQAISYEEISLRGRDNAIDSWQQERDLEHYQLSQSEYDREHTSGIDFETQLMDIVRRGDTEAVKKLMVGPIPDMDEIGEAAKSQQKQAEYLTVSLLTLLTRAAVEGGVNSRKAHELGDVFLREVEAASLRGEPLTMIGYRAMFDFAEQVRRVREERKNISTITEACKDYVEKNLRKDLEVGDIAPAIGVSRTHLAHKFKEVEGITVQQYIQRERCRHAANLLRYSDYSIALIAEYMKFSSQSYFGSCFKQWYGMTPKEYRLEKQQK